MAIPTHTVVQKFLLSGIEYLLLDTGILVAKEGPSTWRPVFESEEQDLRRSLLAACKGTRIENLNFIQDGVQVLHEIEIPCDGGTKREILVASTEKVVFYRWFEQVRTKIPSQYWQDDQALVLQIVFPMPYFR